jgi:hypothetical protein
VWAGWLYPGILSAHRHSIQDARFEVAKSCLLTIHMITILLAVATVDIYGIRAFEGSSGCKIRLKLRCRTNQIACSVREQEYLNGSALPKRSLLASFMHT